MFDLKLNDYVKRITNAPATFEQPHQPPKIVTANLDVIELAHQPRWQWDAENGHGAIRGILSRRHVVPVNHFTGTTRRDITEWTNLIDSLKKLSRQVYSERESEQACRDCVLQNALTPIKEVVDVATRVVKTERMRIVSYCAEFAETVERILGLAKKNLYRGLPQDIDQMRAMTNALKQVRNVLHREMSLLWELDEQAQHVMSQLREATLHSRSTATITHAFARPSRHILLHGAEAQSQIKKLYTTYLLVLDELRRGVLPAVEGRIIVALSQVQVMQSSTYQTQQSSGQERIS